MLYIRAEATVTQTLQKASGAYVQVLGGRVHLLKGGSGEPLVIFHRDNGYPGWQPFHQELARQFTLYIPTHPGYHNSDPPAWTWLWSLRDLAIVHLHLLRLLGLDRVTVVGLGFGGWLAAEMATMCDHHLKRMVLVSPMGIKPNHGEIYDQFLVNTETYARTGFYDQKQFDAIYGAEPPFEQLDAWETDREMTSRLAWKPYMYNALLPRLLRGVTVPTLVVWGREDRVVPLECGELYREAIANARLEVLPDCGHAVDLEKPRELARLITDFVTRP